VFNQAERSAVRLVSKLAPWLAPFPSAFFVARSSVAHLALPGWVAAVVAAVIEALGIVTVHTALWMSDWNRTKRKSDPAAPTWVAVALVGVYLATTLSMIVVLETFPQMSTFAPAMFPFMAMVGAVNLALIARQEKRELDVQLEKAERAGKRAGGRSRMRPSGVQDTDQVNGETGQGKSKKPVDERSIERARRVREMNRTEARRHRREAILDRIRQENGHLNVTQLAEELDASRTTIYSDLDALKRAGRVAQDGECFIVLDSNGRRNEPLPAGEGGR